MRLRKPCTLLLCRFLGWYVLFMLSPHFLVYLKAPKLLFSVFGLGIWPVPIKAVQIKPIKIRLLLYRSRPPMSTALDWENGKIFYSRTRWESASVRRQILAQFVPAARAISVCRAQYLLRRAIPEWRDCVICYLCTRSCRQPVCHKANALPFPARHTRRCTRLLRMCNLLSLHAALKVRLSVSKCSPILCPPAQTLFLCYPIIKYSNGVWGAAPWLRMALDLKSPLTFSGNNFFGGLFYAAKGVEISEKTRGCIARAFWKFHKSCAKV